MWKGILTLFIWVLIIVTTGCKKTAAPPANKTPVVNAGASLVITLPEDSVMLVGSAADADGSVVTYEWSQVSGLTSSNIINPVSSTTKVKALQQGTYVFQLKAIDDKGASGVDTASVVVNPSPIHTLVFQPANNTNEAFIYSVNPTTSTSAVNQLTVATWTSASVNHYWRTFLKFDLTGIPTTSTILNAKLSLYATPTPQQGNGVDAHSGTSNACWIQRVTSNWTTSTITWNNQPSVTNAGQAVVPQSTSAFQNDLDIDVTAMVQAMLTGGNYGFGIRLQNEVIYNARQFASSFATNAAIRPKLSVTYLY